MEFRFLRRDYEFFKLREYNLKRPNAPIKSIRITRKESTVEDL